MFKGWHLKIGRQCWMPFCVIVKTRMFILMQSTWWGRNPVLLNDPLSSCTATRNVSIALSVAGQGVHRGFGLTILTRGVVPLICSAPAATEGIRRGVCWSAPAFFSLSCTLGTRGALAGPSNAWTLWNGNEGDIVVINNPQCVAQLPFEESYSSLHSAPT